MWHKRSNVFSTIWNQGDFFAGSYSLESLENAVLESDFAVSVALTPASARPVV